MAHDVLEHDDGVVDHEPDRQREREQGHVVDRKIERVHRRAGADERNRHRERGNDRCRDRAQEQEDHQHDQADRYDQRLLHVGDRLADRDGAVVEHFHADRRRDRRAVLRQARAHGIHHRHRVGIGLALDRQHDRTVVVEPARDLVVLDAVDDARDLVKVDRRAVAVGHHDLAIFLRLGHGAGGGERHALLRPVERPDRGVRIGLRDDGADVVERDVARRRGDRVDLHAHGEFLRTVDQHLGDAR